MSADFVPEKSIILSKENVNRIQERFQKAPDTYYAILTAQYTGLRVSEVYGLTWDCVDFDKPGTIKNVSTILNLFKIWWTNGGHGTHLY